MNYSEKTYEEIFEAALQDSLEKGLISHAEEFESYIANQEDISNYYVMDKAVISQMIANIYLDITRVYESAKVEYAEGIDLDDIGDSVGIPRPEASYAEANVLFVISKTQEEDVNITEEVIVSTDSGIEYRTLEDIYIPAGETETTIACRAVTPGVAGKVVEETLINVDSEVSIDLTCTNPSPSSGGEEAYTDDEYRYLLMNWTKIRLKGSLEAYENYFANVDGVDGYKLVPNWDGTGTMKVIVDPGTDYQLNTIYTDLQETVVQATEDIYMTAPTVKYIDVYATVNVDIDQINPYSSIEKENIKSKIITAIKIFIDGGYTNDGEYYPGLSIGEDFIPHKLAVFLDDEIPELKSIIFHYPEDYVEILDEEQGKANNITIEMV